MNSSSVGNSSTNSGGCDLNKYAWCAGLSRVNPWIYYGAIVLLIGPAFPNINVAMNTLFSRIIGPRMQSTQQGLLEMHGAIGRLIGPLLISFFYSSYGVRQIWLLECCQIILMISLWLLFYSRLVPLKINTG
uniref:MFS domain-containing protein n=1 Tax=Globodera pallida TaxID=36090 RepID=A0A183C9L7_GLOPA